MLMKEVSNASAIPEMLFITRGFGNQRKAKLLGVVLILDFCLQIYLYGQIFVSGKSLIHLAISLIIVVFFLFYFCKRNVSVTSIKLEHYFIEANSLYKARSFYRLLEDKSLRKEIEGISSEVKLEAFLLLLDDRIFLSRKPRADRVLIDVHRIRRIERHTKEEKGFIKIRREHPDGSIGKKGMQEVSIKKTFHLFIYDNDQVVEPHMDSLHHLLPEFLRLVSQEGMVVRPVSGGVIWNVDPVTSE